MAGIVQRDADAPDAVVGGAFGNEGVSGRQQLVLQTAVLAELGQQSPVDDLLPYRRPFGVVIGGDGPAQQLYRLGIRVFHHSGGGGGIAAAQGLLMHQILLRVEVCYAVHGEHRRIPVAEPAVGAVFVEKAHHVSGNGRVLLRDGELLIQRIGALIRRAQRYRQLGDRMGLVPVFHRHQRRWNGELGRPAALRAQRGDGYAAIAAGEGCVQHLMVTCGQHCRLVGMAVIYRRRYRNTAAPRGVRVAGAACLRGAAQEEGKLHVQTSCVFAHSIILPGKSQRRALPFSRKDGMIQKNARRHRHGHSRPLP